MNFSNEEEFWEIFICKSRGNFKTILAEKANLMKNDYSI